VRTVVGYHRYDTPAELVLLNQLWVLQSQITNFFLPQQKLIAKVRDGAKVTRPTTGPPPRTSVPTGTAASPVTTRRS